MNDPKSSDDSIKFQMTQIPLGLWLEPS